MIIIRMQTYSLFFTFRRMMAENPPHGMYRTQAYAESHNRLLTLFLQQPSHSRVISEKDAHPDAYTRFLENSASP